MTALNAIIDHLEISGKKANPKTKKVYLAGPMRGLKSMNFPAFLIAAERLREKGYEVWSPAERDLADGLDPDRDEPKEIAYYMQHDLPAVCRADMVVVLPGWEESAGACLEVFVGMCVKREIVSFPTLEPAYVPLLVVVGRAINAAFSSKKL